MATSTPRLADTPTIVRTSHHPISFFQSLIRFIGSILMRGSATWFVWCGICIHGICNLSSAVAYVVGEGIMMENRE